MPTTGTSSATAGVKLAARSLMNDLQDSLFKRDTHALEALRLKAGAGLGRIILDCAIQCAQRGDAGPELAEKALTGPWTKCRLQTVSRDQLASVH